MTARLPVVRERADELRLFDPHTGEEVELATATTDRLAALRCYILDLERDLLAQAKRDIDGELLARMDRAARWSVNANGYLVSAPSPAPSTEYDAEELRGRLDELVADGVLDLAAADAAVEVIISFKAKAAGIKALAKLGGPVAEAIDECSRSVDKVRRVSVKPA